MNGFALKEWASVIAAMLAGEQTVMLRKGGIGEKAFDVPHREFHLLPTHLHQRPDLLVPAAREAYAAALGTREEPATARLDAWCEVDAVHAITERAELDALEGFHVLESHYAESRLRWRPKAPLIAVVVRVHRVDPPVVIEMTDAMGGCVSWVEVPAGPPPANPVLDDAAFRARADAVAEALGRARPDSPARATALG